MTDTRAFLAEAQASEKAGSWVKAIDKRRAAVLAALGKTEPVPEPRALDPSNALELLGEVHMPSKRSHYYLRSYWRHLRDFRHSARRVVEVGVQTNRSIAMWEEFFPNATIYGLDIDPGCTAFAGGRKQIFIGDQMDEHFLLDFIQKTGGDFDIVIDDGLHTSYSMVKTFSYLYPALQSHGTYVIEDIINQPEIVSFLHMLMDGVNYAPPDFKSTEWPALDDFGAQTPWLIRNTVSVALHRYIAFIERGFNPRDNRYLITPEELKAHRAAKRAQVAAHAEALKREGVAVTREALVARMGANQVHHVHDYLQDKT